REENVQNVRKMARSAPPPPFGQSGVAAVVPTASLACQNAVKAQKFAQLSRVIRGIPGRNAKLGTLVYAESLVRDRMPPCRRKLRRRAVSSARKIRAST